MTRRIAVVHGPNLNALGRREPEIYGSTTLAELDLLIAGWARELGVEARTFQSNHEGALIDHLHELVDVVDGVVLNPGALTHYSYALHDAVVATGLPTVEVHISNVRAREPWRRVSVVAPACRYTVFGRGIEGYRWALRRLLHVLDAPAEVVPYGEGPDRIAELRLPDGEGPHPVVVLLHGGFWRDPWTRDTLDAAAVELTRRGWATWNLEYRRVGAGGGWPATLHDVAAGIDALAEVDAPVDTGRIVLLGHSAGGHLALWAAARRRLPVGAPGAAPRVHPAGVVAVAPVADLAQAHRSGVGGDAVEAFLRRGPEDGSDRYAVADPRRLLPLGVPMALVHGEADDVVPPELSTSFADAAERAGDAVEVVLLPDVRHMAPVEPTDPAWRPVADAVDRLTPPRRPAGSG